MLRELHSKHNPNEHTMNDTQTRILRPKEVAEMLGITISTLNRYAKRPEFPQKVRLSPRHTGYYQHELKAYLDNLTQREASDER